MTKIATTLRSCRRLVLLTALVSSLGLTALVSTPSPTEASPTGNCTYYNNASHTTVVGQRGKDCCNNVVSWGSTSAFSVCGGCFVCVPPPPN